MKKKKNKNHRFFDDFELEDYDEYDDYENSSFYDDADEDENFNNAIVRDFSDVTYDDFNKAIEYDEDDNDDDEYDEEIIEDEEDEEDTPKKVRVVRKGNRVDETDLVNAQLLIILNNFWLVFRIIGIALAVILFFYLLINGRIGEFLSYLLLLVGSFMFGFVFMYFVNKLMDN